MALRQVRGEGMNLINQAQGREKRQALVNTVMNFSPIELWEFLD